MKNLIEMENNTLKNKISTWVLAVTMVVSGGFALIPHESQGFVGYVDNGVAAGHNFPNNHIYCIERFEYWYGQWSLYGSPTDGSSNHNYFILGRAYPYIFCYYACYHAVNNCYPWLGQFYYGQGTGNGTVFYNLYLYLSSYYWENFGPFKIVRPRPPHINPGGF